MFIVLDASTIKNNNHSRHSKNNIQSQYNFIQSGGDPYKNTEEYIDVDKIKTDLKHLVESYIELENAFQAKSRFILIHFNIFFFLD